MSTFHPWVMWFFAVLFFAYQFVMRVFTGLVVPEIMTKFQVDATEFGLFSAMYYYGYAGMQIPIAFLLDRYGPRIIISLCCFLCASSILLLYIAESWYLALLARFMIGAGSAAGFLGASKVISLWFPFRTYARMVGLTFTLGLLGALYGGEPVSHLITLYGWENVLLIIGGAGFFLTFFLVLVIKPYKVSFLHEGPSFIRNFKSLLGYPALLLMAGANFLMVGPLEGFADVWGVPYLMQVYALSKGDAAFITTTIFTGMMLGAPFLAYLAEKLNAANLITALCGLIMAALFAIMLIGGGELSYITLYLMMFVVGILCCYQVLVFAIGTTYVPENMRGVTVAFLNCINMLGGSFFHTSIGLLMDTFWLGQIVNGERIYGNHAYDYALWIIPIAAFIGGCIFLFLWSKPQKKLSYS